MGDDVATADGSRSGGAVHLPYIQIANEVLDITSIDVAADVGCSPGDAYMAITKVLRYGLERCKEHAPPSAQDILEGPNAARKVTMVAGLPCEPEVFVEACERARYAVLERRPDGLRFRGLARYDTAWRKNYKEAAAEWDAKRLRPDTGRIPAGKRTETGGIPERQMQTQTHIESKTFAGAAAPPLVEAPPASQATFGAFPAASANVEGEQPKPKKKPRGGPEKVANPRHAPLVERTGLAYRHVFGEDWVFDGSDAAQLSKLLEREPSDERIAWRWVVALRHRGFPQVRRLRELVEHWGQFAGADPPAASAPRVCAGCGRSSASGAYIAPIWGHDLCGRCWQAWEVWPDCEQRSKEPGWLETFKREALAEDA